MTTMLDEVGWRSYPSWEVFGRQTPLGCTLAVPVSRTDHWLGARGAPVTIVFYGDYTNAASRSVYADLKQIESLAGRRLAIVYRHLVDLDSDGAAMRFAEAAEAAGTKVFSGPHTTASTATCKRRATTSPRRPPRSGWTQTGSKTISLSGPSFPPCSRTATARVTVTVFSAPRLFINEVAVPAGVEVRELWTLVQDELRRAEETLRRTKATRAKPPARDRGTTATAHDYGAWAARRRTRQNARSATAGTG